MPIQTWNRPRQDANLTQLLGDFGGIRGTMQLHAPPMYSAVRQSQRSVVCVCPSTHGPARSFVPARIRHAPGMLAAKTDSPSTCSTPSQYHLESSTNIDDHRMPSVPENHEHDDLEYSLEAALAWCMLLSLNTAPAALAVTETMTYNPSTGAGLVKNIVGVAYLLLVGYFLYRLLTKRAQRARKERLASSKRGDVQEQVTQLLEDEKRQREAAAATEAARATLGTQGEQLRSPLQALGSSLICGVMALGMYLFASRLQEVLDGQTLPDQYTVRNVGITVRTILVGLVYLATFIFGANSIGLFGLGVQMVIDPKGLQDSLAQSRRPPPLSEPQLPKVTVRARPDELRRAFNEVAQTGSRSSLSSTDAEETNVKV